MAAPTLDGTASNIASTTSTVTVTLTTTKTNDIVVVMPYCEVTSGAAPTVSSVTGGGLNFVRRSQSNGSTHGNLEIWWAASTAIQSATVFTVTYSGGFDDNSTLAFGVNGCNMTKPWDGNGSLPQKVSYNGTATPSLTISTSNPNDFILFANGIAASLAGIPAIPANFTHLGNRSNGGGLLFSTVNCEYRAVTSKQSGYTITASAAGGGNNAGECLIDVLTADSSGASWISRARRRGRR